MHTLTHRSRSFRALWPCLGVAALLLIGVGCKQQESGRQLDHWRFAIEEVKGSVQYAYAQEFKRQIERRSKGQVKVTVYPYGTVGTSDQILELLHTNTLQFAMASPGHLGKTIKALQFFSLHFLFSDNDAVNKAVLSDGKVVNETLRKLYGQRGFRLLSIYPEGWQVWTSNKPLQQPSDFAGFKMRVMTSPILLESYKAYGASPVPLPYSEVYSGLQLKMIDGQVNPVFAIEEMSFYEVSKYLVFPKAALFVTSAITNLTFYKSLSPKRQRWVRETTKALNDYIFRRQADFNRKRLETIKRKKPGIKLLSLTSAQRKIFRKASRKAYQWYYKSVGEQGKRIVAQFRAEIQAAEARFKRQAVRRRPAPRRATSRPAPRPAGKAPASRPTSPR